MSWHYLLFVNNHIGGMESMTDPERKAYQIEFRRLRREAKKYKDSWIEYIAELNKIWANYVAKMKKIKSKK